MYRMRERGEYHRFSECHSECMANCLHGKRDEYVCFETCSSICRG